MGKIKTKSRIYPSGKYTILRLLFFASLPFLALFGFLLYCSWMPSSSYSGQLQELNPEQNNLSETIKLHVKVLADEIGERHVNRYQSLEKSAQYIEKQLESYQYTTSKQEYEVRQKMVRNIIAEIPGKKNPKEIVVIGAHYDTVYGCRGANDNATGVAALLVLAKHFKNISVNKTLRFVAFVNEEPPFFKTDLMGSYVYAKACKEKNENIIGMLSLETMGYFSDEANSQKYPALFDYFYPNKGNFIAFVGNNNSRSLVHQSINEFRNGTEFPSEGTAAPEWFQGIDWSDHGSFWKFGYKGLMVTDTAPFRYKHYHTKDDTWDKIDYNRLAIVVDGLKGVVDKIVNE